MKTRTIQYFSDQYLEKCNSLSSEQIVQFLDDFRLIHCSQAKTESKLISIKMPVDLLNAFKTQAELDGIPYQTRIKKIMREWLINRKLTDAG